MEKCFININIELQSIFSYGKKDDTTYFICRIFNGDVYPCRSA